jgi:hypothetical protein
MPLTAMAWGIPSTSGKVSPNNVHKARWSVAPGRPKLTSQGVCYARVEVWQGGRFVMLSVRTVGVMVVSTVLMGSTLLAAPAFAQDAPPTADATPGAVMSETPEATVTATEAPVTVAPSATSTVEAPATAAETSGPSTPMARETLASAGTAVPRSLSQGESPHQLPESGSVASNWQPVGLLGVLGIGAMVSGAWLRRRAA